MKKKSSLQRLQQRKQALKQREAYLEAALEEDWADMQEGIQSGRFLRDAARSFILRRIYSREKAGDAFIATAGRVAIELAEKAEALFISTLEKLIQKITQKVESWFSGKEETEEEEEA